MPTYEVCTPIMVRWEGSHRVNHFRGELLELSKEEAAPYLDGEMLQEPGVAPYTQEAAPTAFTQRAPDGPGSAEVATLTAPEGEPAVNDASPTTPGVAEDELKEINDKLERELAEDSEVANDAVEEISGEEEDDEALLDPETATVKELADWIVEDRPTVDEIVNAADGDSSVASKLVRAARAARDTRSTVYSRLKDINDKE